MELSTSQSFGIAHITWSISQSNTVWSMERTLPQCCGTLTSVFVISWHLLALVNHILILRGVYFLAEAIYDWVNNGHVNEDVVPWASYQIRKLQIAHAPGMPGTFSPTLGVSDPDMHHSTCVAHVLWCMPGSLLAVSFEVNGEENVPGIPGTCATRNFAYLIKGPWKWFCIYGSLCGEYIVHQ